MTIWDNQLGGKQGGGRHLPDFLRCGVEGGLHTLHGTVAVEAGQPIIELLLESQKRVALLGGSHKLDGSGHRKDHSLRSTVIGNHDGLADVLSHHFSPALRVRGRADAGGP